MGRTSSEDVCRLCGTPITRLYVKGTRKIDRICKQCQAETAYIWKCRHSTTEELDALIDKYRRLLHIIVPIRCERH